MSIDHHIERKPAGDAGDGLFATDTIPAGKEIFSVEQPLAYVLDTPHLLDTCVHCLRKATKNDDSRTMEVKLKRCMGCKVVRYCGESGGFLNYHIFCYVIDPATGQACQLTSYKHGHRNECNIFSALYPNVLPNTVRLILLLLVRRQSRSLSDKDWSAFLAMPSHVAEIKSQKTTNGEGLTAWQTIELMSQAATKYSGTRESMNNVQGMVARILVNTHTLITPTLDPLGLCLAQKSAVLNHSCTPNSHIVFSGQKLSLRSLDLIERDSELTIAYIDVTQQTTTRKLELQARYFFECRCSQCISCTTNGMPDPPIDSAFDQIESRVLDLESQSAHLPLGEAVEHRKFALGRLSAYPPYRQPYAIVQQKAFLDALAQEDWLGALKYALEAYFLIEPVHYPLKWHPVRVVKAWVLLKLVIHIVALLQDGNGRFKALDLSIDWQIVVGGLWKEVHDGVEMSHGEGSPFAQEVESMGQGMEHGGAHITTKALNREWGKLKELAGGFGS